MARNTKYDKTTKRSRSKSSNPRPRGGDSKEISQSTVGYKGEVNEIEWYFNNKELAEQASQLSFQSVLGFGDVYGVQVPTIARIDTAMCPGVTESAQEVANGTPFAITKQYNVHRIPQLTAGKSGVNLMAAKLYTTLSSFTGRTASYAPQDVAMMVLGISAIAEFSETIRRAFGIALTYNYRNRTLPLGLLRSMGLDTQDFVSNLSIYRMRFNVAMARINQIPLLESIAFIRKSRDFYQYIYQDDPTDMSQLFYYFPRVAYYIDETSQMDGTCLKAYTIPDRFSTDANDRGAHMSQWLEILENQITQVLESSTLNFVYADLLNMANKLKVSTWKFDYLAENYVVMPIYNQIALLQFHNCNFTGEPSATPNRDTVVTKAASGKIKITSGYDIMSHATDNNVVFNPLFVVDGVSKAHVVDMDSNNPDLKSRIESLRLHSAWSGTVLLPTDFETGTVPIDLESGTCGITCMALPDHFPVKMCIWRNLDNTALSTDYINSMAEITSNVIHDYGSVTRGKINEYAQLSQWTHAPLFFNVNIDYTGAASSASSADSIYGNLQFYTTITYEYIRRLLDIMYVGLFDFTV